MFAEIKNGAVVTFPYDYDTLVQKNPYTKFAQTDLLSMYSGTEANLEGNELVRIVETNTPSFDNKTQKIVKNLVPTLLNNVWTLEWTIQSLSQTEQDLQNDSEAKSVRQIRSEKLKNCDWTQVSDSPVDKTAWATYRQSLRDLPSATGFPWDMEWPTEP